MNTRIEAYQFRNEHPTITVDDFFKATRVEFQDIAAEATLSEKDATWDALAGQGLEYHKSPLSESEYLVNRNTGDVYRRSSHWGERISSCVWTLRSGGVRLTNYHTIGRANVADFEAIITPAYLMKLYIKKAQQL